MKARPFANPVVPGFNPDPSLCRVGRDFFLVTSSFEYFPGLPIYRSRDLVTWRLLGHVLTRKSQLDLTKAGSSRGLFAPTIRHDGRRFVVVCTLVDGGGNFLVTARRPEGPWSEPVWLDEEGIDPSLCFHEGRVFYTRNGKGTDVDHPFIYQTELSPRTWRPRGPMRVIWRGLGGIWPEAPHLYFLRGRYYLMVAEGGTSYGHTELIARADTPYGPFEPYAGNPILSHVRRRGHPIQATGHADLVTLDDGSVWAVFLGIRPHDGRHHHLGRETFLAPVTFTKDGWPVIGEGGRVELRMKGPALRRERPVSHRVRDDFDGRRLSPDWLFLRNPPDAAITLGARPSHLRLRGTAATLDEVGASAFLGRRQQHLEMRCRVEVDFQPRRAGEEAGLTVRAREAYHLDVFVHRGPAGRELRARRRTGGPPRMLGRAPLPPEGPVRLEIAAKDGSYTLRGGSGRHLRLLGQVPARAISAEAMSRRGIMHFTGAVLGVYATGGGRRSTSPADFDWLEYVPR